MAWVRAGETPEQIKVSFIVSAKDHPEYPVQFGAPYRSTSKTLRDILSDAVKAAGFLVAKEAILRMTHAWRCRCTRANVQRERCCFCTILSCALRRPARCGGGVCGGGWHH